MFSKKGFRLLLLSAMAMFFIIALFVYMFYISSKSKAVKVKPPREEYQVENQQEEVGQNVIAQNVDQIDAHTNVVFEIVDQLGFVTQTNMYPGVNWLDFTKVQMSQMYPDYMITNFEKDQVVLTRVIERKIEPDYILTHQDGHVIIAILRNGHKIFYKETGFEQHDFSKKLGKVLEKGIAITLEQKEAILEDSEELYMILQEYDE